jgi:hypothetical protein
MAIENAKITKAELTMADYGCLTLRLIVEGNGWGVTLGGFVLGSGYLDADEFKGYAKGTEEIMRVMDTVGVERFSDLEGQYVRVEIGSLGDTVTKFGNIIKNKWFDFKKFHEKENT